MRQAPDVSIAIIGSGGAGALTAGNFLLEAACAAGWHGLLTRSVGPQIRGGEAAALIRLAQDPVECAPDHFDLLIAIDWLNAGRFEAEIPLGPQSLVVGDPEGGAVPPGIAASGARLVEIPMKALAKALPEGRANMIALGIAAKLLGLGADVLLGVMDKRLAEKGAVAIAASRAGLEAGSKAAAELELGVQSRPATPGAAKRWLISGNEATGLGAVRGGIRFAAAYPITPATEILEWLAPNLARIGGALVQAEDELADQIRAGGPQPRRLRLARRCAASGAGAAVGRRLPVHHAVGGVFGRNPAVAGDRALRSVHGTIARCRRASGGHGFHRPAAAGDKPQRRLSPLRAGRRRRIGNGRPGHVRRTIYRGWAHPHRTRRSDQQRGGALRAARQAARQARELQLRRPLGEDRGRRRSRRRHLGIADGGGARGDLARAGGRHRRAASRAAIAGAGAARSVRPRTRRRAPRAGSRAEPRRAIPPLPAGALRAARRSPRLAPARPPADPSRRDPSTNPQLERLMSAAEVRACRPADYRSDVKPVWCPGCGDHHILLSFTRAFAELGEPPENIAVISGIGCSSRIPAYTNCYGFHGVHGRSLALAAGLKVTRPDLTVVVASGDGDGYSIGGNHFLHACRRNLDMTYVVMDDRVYGMAKGQPSPTTEPDFDTALSPGGTGLSPFHPLVIALASGANFVARAFSGEHKETASILVDAIRHPGFSFVEILSPCVTFRPDEREWKTLVRPAPVAATDDPARAARRLMTDDGFNIGILYIGDRDAYPANSGAAQCTPADLEAEFAL